MPFSLWGLPQAVAKEKPPAPPGAPKHPAPYSSEVVPVMADLLEEHLQSDHPFSPRVLDPFAGVGGIHKLRDRGFTTIGVELEREWAEQSAIFVQDITSNSPSARLKVNYTQVGNALALPFSDDQFDAVLTSPCYGNRMADHHVARDSSHRRSYRHYLGRELSAGNAGSMQWGDEYRDFHSKAWNEVRRVLVPGGVFILNIKDHQRDKRRAHVSNWHYMACRELGFELVDVRRVPTPGYRRGENREIRYPERLLVFRSQKAMKSSPRRFSREHDPLMTFDTEGFPATVSVPEAA